MCSDFEDGTVGKIRVVPKRQKLECCDHEVAVPARIQTCLLRASGGLKNEFRGQRILRCCCRQPGSPDAAIGYTYQANVIKCVLLYAVTYWISSVALLAVS